MSIEQTQSLRLAVTTKALPMTQPFAIHGFVFNELQVIRVEISDGRFTGRGEAAGIYYFHETVSVMERTLQSVAHEVERGIDRSELRRLLPPCGARNALDAALWELESRRAGVPVHRLAGTTSRPLLTTFTIGADEPAVMAREACNFAQARALKLKLTGDAELDGARIRAVRDARPETWIGVDANQGYNVHSLPALFPHLIDTRVELLEQPCKRGCESDLDHLQSPVPVAADESAQHLGDLDALVGRFDVVNIKLDKCGGLTEGLLMAERARELGLQVMVGNMGGSSLAMAPGFILGQHCDVVDLDGLLYLTDDIFPGVSYEDGKLHCADGVWGSVE